MTDMPVFCNGDHAVEPFAASPVTKRSLQTLQKCLEDFSLPPLIEAKGQLHTSSADGVTIAVLCEDPVAGIPLSMEGARLGRCKILLVLESGWVHRTPLTTESCSGLGATHALFISAGVSVDRGGQACLEQFHPPEKVTYFVDLTTQAGGLDGSDMASFLDCATSSLPGLQNYTCSALCNRQLLLGAGLSFPRCVAFSYTVPPSTQGAAAFLGVFTLQRAHDNRGVFRQGARRIREELQGRRVVVKYSGSSAIRNTVEFFEAADIDGVVGAAERLLPHLEGPLDCILIEEFVNSALITESLCPATCQKPSAPANDEGNGESRREPRPLNVAQVSPNREGHNLFNNGGGHEVPDLISLKVRALVARAPWEAPVVTTLLARVGNASEPINSNNGVLVQLDAALKDWNLLTREERRRLTRSLTQIAEEVMKCIMDADSAQSGSSKGGPIPQTDMIGVDFIVTSAADGVFQPYIIKVQDHRCSAAAHALEAMTLDQGFPSVRPWVATMVSRAETRLLTGKRILIVGPGDRTKAFMWEGLKREGVRAVLVGPEGDHPAYALVDDVIKIPDFHLHGEGRDEAHAAEILRALQVRKIAPAGCLTCCEDCCPLTGLLNSRLEMRGNTYEAHMLAKSKFHTQHWLMQHSDASVAAYASRVFYVHTEADVSRAWAELGNRPSVIKLGFGAVACGVFIVETEAAAREKFQELQAAMGGPLTHSKKLAVGGASFGNGVVLMEYVGGISIEVEIIMFGGQCAAAFLSDNAETLKPAFSELGCSMPSRLSSDLQTRVTVAATKCCNGLGLFNGVFNAEFKLTSAGLKLIEVNGRQGGFYVQDWTQRVWGVDLFKANLLIAAGVRPTIYVPHQPLTNVVGRMLYADVYKTAFLEQDLMNRLRELHESGELVLCELWPEALVEPDLAFLPVANIAATGATKEKAKEKSQELWLQLGLEELDPMPATWYLRTF